jgi:ribokinase
MVVTLGGDGVLLVGRDGGLTSVPALPAQAIDTTGAGDAFVGAFACALACGVAPGKAAELACACASTSVGSRGTQTSFPRGERLAELKRELNLPVGPG